jgi:hypothetical protein
LRIAEFTAGPQDRLVLSGFDAMAAEMFVYLVTAPRCPTRATSSLPAVTPRH